MRVFTVNFGQDTGGQSYRIARAFRRLEPEWDVRSMTTGKNYIEYPGDLPPDQVVAEREYTEADVVHLHNSLSTYRRLDRGQGKPAVLHHHGTAYRSRAWYHHGLAQRMGIAEVVSTADLGEIHGLPVLPMPFDVEEVRSIAGPPREPDGKIVVTHAPTDRNVKSTKRVIAAVQRLAGEGHPVELDLIEGAPWRECLRRKARSDIFVDQLILGFGNNAVEAALLGVPAVVGVDPARARTAGIPIPESTRDRIVAEAGGEYPWWEATEDDIVDRLRALVTSGDARAEARERAQEYAERRHDGRVTVDMLKALYEQAGASRGSDQLDTAMSELLHPPRDGGNKVCFRSTMYPTLWVRLEDRRFKFIGGRLWVDPSDAPIIEDYAATNPHFGISRA